MEQTIHAWRMEAPGAPLVRRELPRPAPGVGQVLVEVAGCGVCHTDLGFLYDGVRPGRPLPLTLGHEIAGRVVEAHPSVGEWVGQEVVVPAVLPCGECALCKRGRGSICRAQKFFGSDTDGGFASHLVAPARGLCVVDRTRREAAGISLAELGVLADAVSTPFQAIERAELERGDLAVFVGAGGVGGFGAQIALAKGAEVVAIDVDPERLARLAAVGVGLTLDSRGADPKAIRGRINAFAEERGAPKLGWKIFETSGHAAGQDLAFQLLNHGAVLSVVGFTLDKVSICLSKLMAFDAVARGNWGCVPERYPAALELILAGKVQLGPFVERRPMSRIQETFEELKAGKMKRRPVLLPDFAA